tara:strand:- start:157 stop:513 length:357 start_codon:yes stop_codon:yes gene_type:complete
MRKSILQEKSFQFAISGVTLYKNLAKNKEYVLSKQLLRSSTSVGANIREAQNAQSKKDFIHKLSISQKECDESIYWLELLKETHYIDNTVFMLMKNSATEILLMLKSSIITAKKNMTK